MLPRHAVQAHQADLDATTAAGDRLGCTERVCGRGLTIDGAVRRPAPRDQPPSGRLLPQNGTARLPAGLGPAAAVYLLAWRGAGQRLLATSSPAGGRRRNDAPASFPAQLASGCVLRARGLRACGLPACRRHRGMVASCVAVVYLYSYVAAPTRGSAVRRRWCRASLPACALTLRCAPCRLCHPLCPA